MSDAQPALPWASVDLCPKCAGSGYVTYLHRSRPGVEIIGGKRVPCPLCHGVGTIPTPKAAS